MDVEFVRLQKLYAELGNENLLDLAQDRGNLTDGAQRALDAEVKRRGLTPPATAPAVAAAYNASPSVDDSHENRADAFGVGIPGLMPGAATAVEQALEPEGEVRAGMVQLVSFYDGLELSRACEALEDADISPAIEEKQGDQAQGTPTWFQVWVNEADVVASKQILRERMGLFPLAEQIDAESEGVLMDGEVGLFETVAEAEQVKDMLLQGGFAAAVETDAEADEDGNIWSTVKVAPGERLRAVSYLEETLAVED